MRQPTTIDEQLAWWRSCLASPVRVRAHLDMPQCGYYRYKIVRNGPWVPCRIWIDQEIDPDTGELLDDERMHCEVNGEPKDKMLDRVWTWAEACSEEEYKYLTDLRRWAAWHAPEHPQANPRRPLDPLTTPIPW